MPAACGKPRLPRSCTTARRLRQVLRPVRNQGGRHSGTGWRKKGELETGASESCRSAGRVQPRPAHCGLQGKGGRCGRGLAQEVCQRRRRRWRRWLHAPRRSRCGAGFGGCGRRSTRRALRAGSRTARCERGRGAGGRGGRRHDWATGCVLGPSSGVGERPGQVPKASAVSARVASLPGASDAGHLGLEQAAVAVESSLKLPPPPR